MKRVACKIAPIRDLNERVCPVFLFPIEPFNEVQVKFAENRYFYKLNYSYLTRSLKVNL